MNTELTNVEPPMKDSRRPSRAPRRRARCVSAVAAVVPLVLLALAGCDPAPAPRGAPTEPPTFGDASLTGRVRFLGTPPERKMIQAACHQNSRPIQEETVVVGADQGLANVVVFLKDAPPSLGTDRPRLTLDQIDCRYTPHVVAIQVGQTLRVTTSDEVFHNTSYVSSFNGSINFGLPTAGDFRDLTFSAPEVLRLRCDVHPWMSAFVFVTDHPFFAVTDADGNFSIPQIPAGEYTVGVWHELLGEQEARLTINADATHTFDYAPPAPAP